jgi:hypothetical protein
LPFQIEGFEDVVGIAFTEDPELRGYSNDLGGLVWLTVVGLNSAELDQADKSGIDTVLQARSQQDPYLVTGLIQ